MKESKLVVLGAGGVGKSSLILQYLHGTYTPVYRPTVEDCYNHTLQLPSGLYHALEILDTAGSHCFPAMRELSIRCGRAFVVVFAVNNEQSFHEAKNICSIIQKTKGTENVPIVLVGNKIDLSTQRNVTWQEANDYVTCYLQNGSYLETSAKYNLYINDVFSELLILAFGMPKLKKRANSSCFMSLSISDMPFSRNKSSSTLSSSSNTTLEASGRSNSDYSFNSLNNGKENNNRITNSSSGNSTEDNEEEEEDEDEDSSPFPFRKNIMFSKYGDSVKRLQVIKMSSIFPGEKNLKSKDFQLHKNEKCLIL
ncbi:UNVERIFIED_CONTAM: hypothetical protein RMT77_002565 [Armadillidium vulgare]